MMVVAGGFIKYGLYVSFLTKHNLIDNEPTTCHNELRYDVQMPRSD